MEYNPNYKFINYNYKSKKRTNEFNIHDYNWVKKNENIGKENYLLRGIKIKEIIVI